MWLLPNSARRVLVSVVLLVTWATVLGAPNTFSDGVSDCAEKASISDLPMSARFAISRILGRDNAGYQAVAEPGGYAIENPAQGLSATFNNSGVAVRADASTFRLWLRGYGYGESIQDLDKAVPTAEGNRVEYRRGALTEWYINGPLGVQQGFTLHRPPIEVTEGPLTLVLSTMTAASTHPTPSLKTGLDKDAQGLSLSAPDGAVLLRYDDLLAYDARGRELPTWMEAADGVVRLRVNDTGAVYPLVVDPFIEQAKITASDGAGSYPYGDHFGVSVAVSGDTVVVGAMNDTIGSNVKQGSVYVFVRPGGSWADMTETAKLTASDGVGGDRFGSSVAIDGDTIVVGAIDDDIGAPLNKGSAYVFVRPIGGWAGHLNETAKLIASDGAGGYPHGDTFGYSVAISGDTVVVGASHDDIGANRDQGSAYVFVRPSGGWAGHLNETAKLISSDGAVSDLFGISVAISGDTVVVGAIVAGPTGEDAKGSAYVFVRPVSGWTGTLNETAKFLASDGAVSDFFGISVAVSGDTAVVGAHSDDIADILHENRGSAYVFVRPVSGWTGTLNETAKFLASDGAAGDSFGVSVDINGDTVVVGASHDDIGANRDQGSAYVFVRPSGGWAGHLNETAKLIASDGAGGYPYGDMFGGSVAISGDTLVVAARGDDPGSNEHQGSAYLFKDFDIATCEPGPITISPGIYTGTQLHQSETSLSTNGDVTIASAAEITFEAVTSIRFTPGFRIENESQLVARIAAVSCPADPDQFVQTAQTLQRTGELTTALTIDTGQFRDLAPQCVLSHAELPDALQYRMHTAGATAHEIYSDAAGDYLVFSTDTPLDAWDENDHDDVYLYEVDKDRLQLISTNWDGGSGNGASTHPRIDGAGLHIIYQSEANDLTDTDHNSVSDIYLYKTSTGLTDRLSWPVTGTVSETAATHPAIGGAGPLVLYQREDSLGHSQVYSTTEDCYCDEQVHLVSREQDEEGQWLDNRSPAISSDGRFIAYLETVGHDQVSSCRVVLYDRQSSRYDLSDCPDVLIDSAEGVISYFNADDGWVEWFVKGVDQTTKTMNTLLP